MPLGDNVIIAKLFGCCLGHRRHQSYAAGTGGDDSAQTGRGIEGSERTPLLGNKAKIGSDSKGASNRYDGRGEGEAFQGTSSGGQDASTRKKSVDLAKLRSIRDQATE
jgi:hypothetical protein